MQLYFGLFSSPPCPIPSSVRYCWHKIGWIATTSLTVFGYLRLIYLRLAFVAAVNALDFQRLSFSVNRASYLVSSWVWNPTARIDYAIILLQLSKLNENHAKWDQFRRTQPCSLNTLESLWSLTSADGENWKISRFSGLELWQKVQCWLVFQKVMQVALFRTTEKWIPCPLQFTPIQQCSLDRRWLWSVPMNNLGFLVDTPVWLPVHAKG